MNTGRVPVSGDEGDPEQVPAGFVTPDFFRVMDARMFRGRDFADDDGERIPPPPPGVDPATVPQVPAKVILSYEFWQRRFGGRDDTIGKLVTVGNGRSEIVGVLEPGFELLFPPDVSVERTPGIYLCSRLDFFGGNRIERVAADRRAAQAGVHDRAGAVAGRCGRGRLAQALPGQGIRGTSLPRRAHVRRSGGRTCGRRFSS